MFCPTCGLTEDRPVLYCRSCGTDLRSVRVSLTSPEPPPNSTHGAREEIGRALAARIRDLPNLSELEDALPAIEQFLETPGERRLSRMRAGTVTAAIGLGATVFFALFALKESDMIFAPGLGIVCFLIGIGLIINGRFFTLRQDERPLPLPGQPEEPMNRFANMSNVAALPTGETLMQPASVTENTTRHLAAVVEQVPRSE